MSQEEGGLIERAAADLRRQGPQRLDLRAMPEPRAPQMPLPSEYDLQHAANPYLEILLAIRRHWLLAVIVAGAVMLCAVGFEMTRTPLYQATAELMIQPRRTDITKINPVLSGLPADTDTVSSEEKVLTSHDLVLRLAERLNLGVLPEFDPNIPTGWRAVLLDLAGARWTPSFIGGPIEGWLGSPPLTGQAYENAVVDLVGSHITTTTNAYVIGVTFFSEDPELSSRAANTLVDLYIENQFEMRREAAAQVNKWLGGDLTSLKDKVDAAALRVARFQASNDLVEGRSSSLIQQRISEVDTDLTKARDEKITLAAELKTMASPNSSALVLSSPVIQALRDQEAKLAAENANIGYQFGPNYPHLGGTRASAAEVERKIADQTRRIVGSLRTQYNSAAEHVAALEEQLSALKQEFARVQMAEVTLKQLEEQEAAARKVYNDFLERSNELKQADFALPDALVISHAAVPTGPFSPKKKVILFLGFVIAVIGGCLAALAREKFDGSFRSQEQLERALGLAVAGLVPEFKRRGEESRFDLLSIAGAAMTDIYARLNLAGAQSLLITSALPREGKTTVGLMLARIAAMNGRRVILVDADLRRSGLRSRLAEAGKGLAEILSGEGDLAEAIVADQAVDVVTCGKAVDNPVGLLSAVAMREFLATARRTYDLVIIDSPAIMAGPDAALLSRLADQTLFFVRWAQTPRSVVNVALRRLREAGARRLVAVLTRVDIAHIGKYSYTDGLSYSRAVHGYYTSR